MLVLTSLERKAFHLQNTLILDELISYHGRGLCPLQPPFGTTVSGSCQKLITTHRMFVSFWYEQFCWNVITCVHFFSNSNTVVHIDNKWNLQRFLSFIKLVYFANCPEQFYVTIIMILTHILRWFKFVFLFWMNRDKNAKIVIIILWCCFS